VRVELALQEPPKVDGAAEVALGRTERQKSVAVDQLEPHCETSGGGALHPRQEEAGKLVAHDQSRARGERLE
jgi:hypothetical protein